MAANFADRPHLQRVEWSARTADLDAGTTDLHDDNTSDLSGVRTEDFANSPPKNAVSSALGGSTSTSARSSPTPAAQTRSVTQDIARVGTDMKAPAFQKICEPGTLLNDRFLLEKIIGQGGTATVFCARDLQASDKRSPSARVAIKVPKLDAKDPERAISRLQHEFRHAQSLSHSNIVQVLALGNDQQTWFMTMELIEGNALSTLLRDRQWLSDARKLAILRSCAEALSFAHSHQIVHGDFKPANILIAPDGRAKVFDFGAAAATSGEEDTRIPAGTPAYASPQILNGERPDARDDVFSFACVAYEVLTGEHPFNRRSSLEAREQALVPERAWSLSAEQWLALLSGLAWEREQRPASIELLMRDLSATSAVPQTREPPAAPAPAVEVVEEIVPAQRSWGFFSFILVALAIGVLFLLRDSTAPLTPQTPDTTLADQSGDENRETLTSSTEGLSQTSLMSIMPMTPASAQKLFSGEGPAIDDESRAEERMQVAPSKPAARAVVPLSAIAFSQDRIETPEGSIAAVFIVTRSPPLSGRASVSWKISGGSASIDEDFIASASGGTVHFADGQSQRAIYIPLRNDLDAEGDETFTMELASPRRGRVGSVARVEATIRDDD